MLYVYWIFGVALAVYIIAVLVAVLLFGKGFKHFLFNAVTGFFALVLALILKCFTEINLEFNIYSLAVSCFWGIPGVIMLIVAGFIFL